MEAGAAFGFVWDVLVATSVTGTLAGARQLACSLVSALSGSPGGGGGEMLVA
jgi:hypothetical protein